MRNKITIYPLGIGGQGQRYRVLHSGHVLLESCREPLFEACRALVTDGVTGVVEMWRPGKAHPDMTVDIERGARLAVVENATRGPILAAWRQFEGADQEMPFPVPTGTANFHAGKFLVGTDVSAKGSRAVNPC